MAADNNGKNYVYGKGKLYFDPFAPNSTTLTGERYFGNTPEISVSSSQDTLDHYDADEGINVKDESITIQDDMTGQFVTDNISLANVGLFFGGDAEEITIASATAATYNTPAVKKGRWYQIGVSPANPDGTRKITNVSVKVLAATVNAANNYEVDLDRARIWVEADAPDIDEDDVLIVTYDQTAVTKNTVVGAGSEVRGALRYVATNPVGPKKDIYWPMVKITPNGDFSLKGDEWQQIPFSFEILKKDSSTERAYITEA